MALLAQSSAEGDGQEALAQAGFTNEEKIFLVMEEAKLSEFRDFGLGDIFVEGVVPVLEVGTETEASLSAQSFSGSVFAREQFILEKEAEKLQGVELLGQSLLSSSVTGFVNAKQAHLMG